MIQSILKKSAILALVTFSIVLCSCNTSNQSSTVTEFQTIESSEKTTEQAQTTEEITTTEPKTAEPVKNTIRDESWKQVYINYLNGSDNANNFEYALVYVDEDEIPELYKHGKQRPMSSEIFWIFEGSVYSQSLMIDGFEYHEKENLFFSTGIQAGVQSDFVYSLSGSETIQKAKGTASRVIQGQERFTWNDENVTENEYNTLRAEAFDSSKAKTVDNYDSLEELISIIENS